MNVQNSLKDSIERIAQKEPCSLEACTNTIFLARAIEFSRRLRIPNIWCEGGECGEGYLIFKGRKFEG